jgi:hypothetical protein
MRTYEINLQHGRITWDGSAWQLRWTHYGPPDATGRRPLIDHTATIAAPADATAAQLGRLAGREIPRDQGPITGTIWIGKGSGRIEIVGSQVDTTWEGP